jgi:hypothetical protein
MQAKVDSSTAERLCREALGEDHEMDWTRLLEAPVQAREVLRAAAKGPEGQISADVWFLDSQNGVGICELRNRHFDFARVFVVRTVGSKWVLHRVYGTPPEIEMPEIVDHESVPSPPLPVVNPLGT